MAIDSNTYYPSGNITIFPSSNAVDSGKLFTEYNGRNITINITDLNYVVSPNPEGYLISYNNTTKKIDVTPGKAIINGFEVNTNTIISYSLPSSGNGYTIVNDGWYKGYYLLCLHTNFDALDNLEGNIQVGSTWYCSGIQILYVSKDTYEANPNEYLLLGGVKPDGTVKPNKDRFQRLDAKYILVKLEGDPETGVPPTQTTDLLTFINNYLKGYWVSKGGDNEYGQLLFKSQPNDYLEEGFDYKTEDPLNSTKFGLKIFNDTNGNIIIKPEEEAANNMITHIIPGIIGFYKGLYAGDTSVHNFDEVIQASSNNLNANTYIKPNLLKLISNYGVVRAVSSNGGPILSIESNLGAHNNVEVGKVIYANGSGSNIQDNDSSTAYVGTINYLVDNQGRIKTADASNTNRNIVLDAVNSLIEITQPNSNYKPILKLSGKSNNNNDMVGIIQLSSMAYEKESNNSSWKNVVDIRDNLRVLAMSPSDSLGSIQALGFIVAGSTPTGNPADITVPDIANNKNNRTLQSGDIYAKQVWSAVYNDIAEIFDVSDDLVGKDIVRLLLAVDNSNPTKYTLADKNNTCIVGVISENPAFCAGGDNCEHGVPVALCGRVEVKYQGKKPKIGDYVGINKRIPGYVTKCKHNSKYRCGKIIDIIDKSTVKILVLM